MSVAPHERKVHAPYYSVISGLSDSTIFLYIFLINGSDIAPSGFCLFATLKDGIDAFASRWRKVVDLVEIV